MKWICEWCEPSDFVKDNPSKCRILYCLKHKCETWHWPKQINQQGGIMEQHIGQHGRDCEICNKVNRDFAEIGQLQQDKAELQATLRNAYEVYAGMEGIPKPETAVEAYLLNVIKDMIKEISKGLK